jgi:Xaa-Pro dipeptidase
MTPEFLGNEPLPVQFYRDHVATMCARFDRALDSAGARHAVVYSGAPKPVFLDDSQYPFKANPHFLSWVPLTRLPYSCIVYTPGETPTLIYYMPRDYWHVVPGEPSGDWTGCFRICVVHSLDAVLDHLPADRENCIFIGETGVDSPAFGIERRNPAGAMNILRVPSCRRRPRSRQRGIFQRALGI